MFVFIIDLMDFEPPTSWLTIEISLSFLDFSYQWLSRPSPPRVTYLVQRGESWPSKSWREETRQSPFSQGFQLIFQLFLFSLPHGVTIETQSILVPGNCPLLLSCSIDGEIQALHLLWGCPCPPLDHLGICCLVCLSPHVSEHASTGSTPLEQLLVACPPFSGLRLTWCLH